MKEFILSNSEAQQVDRYAIDILGISGTELMRKAGGFVSLKVKRILKDVPNSRVDIFCGTGNNGGDGFVAACDLYDWGANVFVWVVGDSSKIKDDTLVFYRRCIEKGVSVQSLKNDADLSSLQCLGETDMIVDGLIGTGFHGEIHGMMAEVIRIINDSKSPVLSIDIPSGVSGDTGQIGNLVINAKWTVTMGFLKRGLLFYPGTKYAGEVFVVDLNYPKKSFEVLKMETFLIGSHQVKSFLPPIPEDTYKHRQGKVLVIAGSPGMTGAATLTATAAMRGGAGLVIVATPESLNPILEVKLTEALTYPVMESQNHTFYIDSFEAIKEKIVWSDVVVFGPGVSVASEVIEFGTHLLSQTEKPLIVDADGLRVFQKNLNLINRVNDIILTPHHGEFSMMTGLPVSLIKERTIDVVREFVSQHPCTLVLKGAPTVIVAKDGTVAVNPTGNPALATGGTGDILTGLISAFRAQGVESFDAAMSAVFIHGAAGDLGRKKYGIRSFIASDLFEFIPKILKQMERIQK